MKYAALVLMPDKVCVRGLHNVNFPFKPKSQISCANLTQALGFAQVDVLLRQDIKLPPFSGTGTSAVLVQGP